MTLSGPIKDKEISLYPGKNLMGIPFLSFHENLLDVSLDLMKKKEGISSIHYYQSQAGKWTGSYDFFGKICGPCTKVKKGSGCLVYISN